MCKNMSLSIGTTTLETSMRYFSLTERCDVDENYQYGKHVDNAGSVAERCSKETGVTGETFLLSVYVQI